MKKQINIKWWPNQKGTDIKESHLEALEESGFNRAHEMLAEGFTSGELQDNVRMDDEDPEDGIGYSGHWELVDAPDYGIVQLNNVDGEHAGLYQYDRNKWSPTSVATRIEAAFIDHQDDDSVHEAADEQLERLGIIRVLADEANTNVI